MCNTIHDRIFSWSQFTSFACKSSQTTPVRGRFLKKIDRSKLFFSQRFGFIQFYLKSYSKSTKVWKRLAQELESHHWCGGVTGTDWSYMLLTFNWSLGGCQAMCLPWSSSTYSNWKLFSRRDEEVNPRVFSKTEAPQIEETRSSWPSSSWDMELLLKLLLSWPTEWMGNGFILSHKKDSSNTNNVSKRY